MNAVSQTPTLLNFQSNTFLKSASMIFNIVYAHVSLSNLRLKVYQCLQTWLEVVGASSGLECVAETLVEQLLQDARPQVDITKVTM